MDPAEIPLPGSPPVLPSELPRPLSPKVIGSLPEPAADAHLPASPSPLPRKARHRLLSRRPQGWHSTLASSSPPSFKTKTSATDDETSSPPKSPSSELEPQTPPYRSGIQSQPTSRVSTNGRKVSGAMQYALLPSPPTSPSSSAGYHSPSPAGTMRELDLEDDEPLLPQDGEGEGEGATSRECDSSMESGTGDDPIDWDGVHELTEGLVDPEWMGYVRAQLNALFPDFSLSENATSTLISTPQMSTDRHGAVQRSGIPRMVSDSGSTISSQSLRTPPTASSMAHIMQHAQETAARHAMDNSSSGAEPGISMREEITAMREEMERLRTFVGDLAGGMGRQERDAPVVNGIAGTDTATQVAVEQHTGDGDVPQGCIENIEICAEIIRMVHRSLHHDTQQMDEEIFKRDNLEAIMARLKQGGTL